MELFFYYFEFLFIIISSILLIITQLPFIIQLKPFKLTKYSFLSFLTLFQLQFKEQNQYESQLNQQQQQQHQLNQQGIGIGGIGQQQQQQQIILKYDNNKITQEMIITIKYWSITLFFIFLILTCFEEHITPLVSIIVILLILSGYFIEYEFSTTIFHIVTTCSWIASFDLYFRAPIKVDFYSFFDMKWLIAVFLTTSIVIRTNLGHLWQLNSLPHMIIGIPILCLYYWGLEIPVCYFTDTSIFACEVTNSPSSVLTSMDSVGFYYRCIGILSIIFLHLSYGQFMISFLPNDEDENNNHENNDGEVENDEDEKIHINNNSNRIHKHTHNHIGNNQQNNHHNHANQQNHNNNNNNNIGNNHNRHHNKNNHIKGVKNNNNNINNIINNIINNGEKRKQRSISGVESQIDSSCCNTDKCVSTVEIPKNSKKSEKLTSLISKIESNNNNNNNNNSNINKKTHSQSVSSHDTLSPLSSLSTPSSITINSTSDNNDNNNNNNSNISNISINSTSSCLLTSTIPSCDDISNYTAEILSKLPTILDNAISASFWSSLSSFQPNLLHSQLQNVNLLSKCERLHKQNRSGYNSILNPLISFDNQRIFRQSTYQHPTPYINLSSNSNSNSNSNCNSCSSISHCNSTLSTVSPASVAVHNINTDSTSPISSISLPLPSHFSHSSSLKSNKIIEKINLESSSSLSSSLFNNPTLSIIDNTKMDLSLSPSSSQPTSNSTNTSLPSTSSHHLYHLTPSSPSNLSNEMISCNSLNGNISEEEAFEIVQKGLYSFKTKRAH